MPVDVRINTEEATATSTLQQLPVFTFSVHLGCLNIHFDNRSLLSLVKGGNDHLFTRRKKKSEQKDYLCTVFRFKMCPYRSAR